MSPVGPALTSIHNPHVKFARSLAHRKVRHRERAFVVEGVRLFEDALNAGFRPLRLFFDPSRIDGSLMQRIQALGAEDTLAHEVTPAVIAAIAETDSPQGIAAIFEFPDVPIMQDTEASLFVVADGIKDPGNLGTLLRSAAAAGTHAVFISPRTADPYAPKVVRAAMGAHFRLPIRPLDWDAPDPMLASCTQLLGAEAGEGIPYDAVDWRQPSAVILGSEATGISERAVSQLTGYVTIPMHGEVESLNAAVAGAVILFEAARQRRSQ
ncbi:MAG TPA: RNA methyltransferase [Nitrolancea sp.]